MELIIKSTFSGVECQRVPALVVSNKAWEVKYPKKRPFWLKGISHLLADPDLADESVRDTSFSIIFSNAEYARFKLQPHYWGESLFGLTYSKVGIIPTGIYDQAFDNEPIVLRNHVTPKQSPTAFAGFSNIHSKPKRISMPSWDRKSRLQQHLEHSGTPDDHDLNALIAEDLLRDRLEVFGPDEAQILDNREEELSQYLQTLSQTKDGRIKAPLLKKPGYLDKIHPNSKTGKSRLYAIVKMLKKKDEIANAFTKLIKSWINDGILEEIPLHQLETKKYTELPYHAVIRKDKSSTPVRPVINGNGCDPGQASANDLLHPGPNILPQIFDIITRIRDKKVFAVGDVSKAFLQIELADEDQHMLVIRWPEMLQNGFWDTKFLRFKRLPFGINCAPFILNASLRYLYRKHAKNHPQDAQKMKELELNSYVDDLVFPDDTEEGTIDTVKTTEKLLGEGQFTLTKYKSFPPSMVQAFGQTPNDDQFKILGANYCPKTDTFGVSMDNLTDFQHKERITKREAAGITARVFDPLGFVTPLTLLYKMERQETEKNHPNAPWNTLLSKEETQRWQALVNSTLPIANFRIPRQLGSNKKSQKLHLFTDASRLATGAVLYMESKDIHGKPFITLLCAKSKITPSKQQLAFEKTQKHRTPNIKINRLELQAAKMGIDMVKAFEKAMGRTFPLQCWTDSQIVIRWLRKGPVTSTAFVDKRITSILSHTTYKQWNHTPGPDNPADLASRGCSASELLQSDLWKQGPPWLTQPSKWPPQLDELALMVTRTGGDSSYLTRDGRQISIKKAGNNLVSSKELDNYLIPNIINPKLPWDKNVVQYAAILRMQRMIRKKLLKQTNVPFMEDRINPSTNAPVKWDWKKSPIYYPEYVRAELAMIRDMQRVMDPDLYKDLSRNPSTMIQGRIWDSEHQVIVYRSRQQLTRSGINPPLPQFDVLWHSPDKPKTIDYEFEKLHNSPVNIANDPLNRDLLYVPRYRNKKQFPKHTPNPAIKLLMEYNHVESGHGSANSTSFYFNYRYWTPQAKKLALDSKKNCSTCKGLQRQPWTSPEAPLPGYRYRGNEAFEACGVDFVGPFPKIKGSTKKIYICVFSCPRTRAVCLQPTTDMTIASFSDAFDIFRHTYSLNPKVMISDNANAFKGSWTRFLLAHKHKVLQAFSKHRMQWHFNANRAPWWGGFYERMMGIIKEKMVRCFQGITFESYTRFCAATAYVQKIINSRPLGMVSDSQGEPMAQTPAMFLNVQAGGTKTDPFNFGDDPKIFFAMEKDELDSTTIRQVQFYKQLWVTFHNNYTSLLRQRLQATEPKLHTKLLKEGQLVLLKNKSPFKQGSFLSKLKWILARIQKLHVSPRDQQIRSVDLKVINHDDPDKPYVLTNQSTLNIVPLEPDQRPITERSTETHTNILFIHQHQPNDVPKFKPINSHYRHEYLSEYLHHAQQKKYHQYFSKKQSFS